MTIDEAIKHCEEVMMENLEKTKDRNASDPIAINCFECADEHRQLAEWLKELKAYREQGGDVSRSKIPNTCGDVISRQALINKAISWNKHFTDSERYVSLTDIQNAPSVTQKQRTGRWIMSDDGLYRPICNNCGAHPWKGYIPTVEEAIEVFKYCPKCGAKMEVSGCTKNI